MEKIKIFQSGNYPQGEFSKEKTKKVFDNIKSADAIYIHSSHWDKKNPIVLGTFENFKTNDNGEVFADLNLNEKGKQYNSDGIFNGVSVEINTSNDSLEKVALLPLGVEPAVNGATVQFEKEKNMFTYQNNINLPKEKIKEVYKVTFEDLKNELKTLDPEKRKEIYEEIKVEFEVKPKVKTEEEIRAEVKAEFETKAEIEKIMDSCKKKVVPALQNVVEFALKKAGEEKETIVEFSKDEKVSYYEKFKKEIESIPENQIFKDVTKNMEFEEVEEKEISAKDRFAAYTKA